MEQTNYKKTVFAFIGSLVVICTLQNIAFAQRFQILNNPKPGELSTFKLEYKETVKKDIHHVASRRFERYGIFIGRNKKGLYVENVLTFLERSKVTSATSTDKKQLLADFAEQQPYTWEFVVDKVTYNSKGLPPSETIPDKNFRTSKQLRTYAILAIIGQIPIVRDRKVDINTSWRRLENFNVVDCEYSYKVTKDISDKKTLLISVQMKSTYKKTILNGRLFGSGTATLLYDYENNRPVELTVEFKRGTRGEIAVSAKGTYEFTDLDPEIVEEKELEGIAMKRIKAALDKKDTKGLRLLVSRHSSKYPHSDWENKVSALLSDMSKPEPPKQPAPPKPDPPKPPAAKPEQPPVSQPEPPRPQPARPRPVAPRPVQPQTPVGKGQLRILNLTVENWVIGKVPDVKKLKNKVIVVGYTMEFSFALDSTRELLTNFAAMRRKYGEDKLVLILIGAGEKDEKNKDLFINTVNAFNIKDLSAAYFANFNVVTRGLELPTFQPHCLVFNGALNNALRITDDVERAKKDVEKLLK